MFIYIPVFTEEELDALMDRSDLQGIASDKEEKQNLSHMEGVFRRLDVQADEIKQSTQK